VRVAAIPASVVTPAFSSTSGARFLAEQLSQAPPRVPATPTYGVVDELIHREPLVVEPTCAVGEVARLMSEREVDYAAVPLGDGRYGLITDTLLRQKVIVGELPLTTPARAVLDGPAPSTAMGESAAGALITLLDQHAEYVLVVDPAGRLRGAVAPTDFVVSTSTAGVALRQQLALAASVEDLADRAQRVPAMLGELLRHDLPASKVIAVYSATVDAMVRRALVLTFQRHPDLDVEAFTWLSLGSNGRREAVLSSDVDSAVAFDASVPLAERKDYRAAFAEVNEVLSSGGVGVDTHGATAAKKRFARTNAEWRRAAEQWLADPVTNQGAIMTSLMVDGRPIHGDPGLPAVSRVFSDLRSHPGTMRLLLQESLSQRAKLRSMRDVLARRAGTFDIKAHAIVPIINIARWAALSVGAFDLPTTDRLRAAAGSAMLPADQAETLIEVFEVLQRIRLRYQLIAVQRGSRPSDIVTMQRLSPIDRSVVAQAVRETATIQRRMDNMSHFVPAQDWSAPAPAPS
jgi:CBS domain-containing protein